VALLAVLFGSTQSLLLVTTKSSRALLFVLTLGLSLIGERAARDEPRAAA
jgi:hypothetical protein